jgi:hypothetical protein
MIWKIALQVLSVLIALLIANLNYIWHDKRTNRFKRARLILYVALLLTFALSVIVTYQDEHSKSRQIAQLTGKLDAIDNQMTGGESYCFVQFSFPVEVNNLINIDLYNAGDYPLYDIQIRMVDLNKYHALKWKVSMPEEEIRKAETIYNMPVIGPHTLARITTFKTPAVDLYGFNIWIHTRYKEFVEESRFKRFNGRWRLAFRLFEQTDNGKKVIFETVSREFQRLSRDEIWKSP